MAVTRRRRSSVAGPFLVLFLMMLTVVIVVGSMYLAGMVQLPYLSGEVQAADDSEPEQPDLTGKVQVPMSATAIPAYHKIRRDDLWSRKVGRISTVYLDEEVVETRGIITEVSQIIGRVAKTDKAEGYVFTEDDFMPKGTTPGIAGGTPPGMRAITLRADRVDGLYDLLPGDRFDMLASIPVEKNRERKLLDLTGPHASRLEADLKLTNWDHQARVRVLAQGGFVVQKVTTRAVPIQASSLTQGSVTRTRPVQEVVVAIRPGEVPAVAEALALEKANIMVVARSGHPDSPQDDGTPDLIPTSPFGGFGDPFGEGAGGDLTVIENISGGVRTLIAVPRHDKSDPSQPFPVDVGTPRYGAQGGESR